MRTTNRFAKGTGVYACRGCDRMTRSTGRGDNEHVLLCAECFDLGGEENHLSDTGQLYSSPAAVLELIEAVATKGGRAEHWAELKAHAQSHMQTA